jgi:ketosteroid isomerase-like protein
VWSIREDHDTLSDEVRSRLRAYQACPKFEMTMIAATFLLAALLVAHETQATDVNADGNPEVIQAVHDIGTAWAQHDVPTLERLVADDYIHTDILGLVQNKDEWLADVRSRAANERPAHELSFEDLKVQMHGDVAVVTGRNIWRLGPGRMVTLPLRFTQVLTKRKGYWQRSVFQAGIAELPRYVFLAIFVVAAVSVLMTWTVLRMRSKLLPRSRAG